MFSKTVMAIALFAIISVTVIGQAPDVPVPPPAGEPPPMGNDTQRVAPPPFRSQEPLERAGDVVIFQSGRELHGIRVVRETPIYVEVEYLPGEPLLQLPRAQVSHVEYARDADEERVAGRLNGLPLSPDIMPGEEVSVEFHRKLMAPVAVAGDELLFEDADYLAVLGEFTDRLDVTLEIAPQITTIAEEERRFSRVIEADATLMDFLRKDLPDIAPEIRVILEYDQLLLQRRAMPDPLEAVPEMTDLDPPQPAVPGEDPAPMGDAETIDE